MSVNGDKGGNARTGGGVDAGAEQRSLTSAAELGSYDRRRRFDLQKVQDRRTATPSFS